MRVKAISLAEAAAKSRAYISAETKRLRLHRGDDGLYDLGEEANRNWLNSKGIKLSVFSGVREVKAGTVKKSGQKPKGPSGQIKVSKKPAAIAHKPPKSEQRKSQSDAEILLESVTEAVQRAYPGTPERMPDIKKDIYKSFSRKIGEKEKETIPEYLKTHKKMSRFVISQFARIAEVEDIGIPTKENQQLRFITTSQMNVISFVLYLLEKIGDIDECIMSYYVIGMKTIELIDSLVREGKIKNLYIQTSTIRMSGKDAKAIEAIRAMMREHGADRIGGNLAWAHTKILCCRIGTKSYVIEGSGNLSDNARIEQYLFERSKRSFDFHKGWIMNVSEICAGAEVVYL